jgi:hypothetical protein
MTGINPMTLQVSAQHQQVAATCNLPNLLDTEETFLYAGATAAFTLGAVADAVRRRVKKIAYFSGVFTQHTFGKLSLDNIRPT